MFHYFFLPRLTLASIPKFFKLLTFFNEVIKYLKIERSKKMSRLKDCFLICLLSFSLFSCASKPLDISEANIIINNIEQKLSDSEFDFPTKITINKLVKKSDKYIDKLSIRFSLEDKFIYFSSGFDETSLNEHWKYVNKEENKIYDLTSITENNTSTRYYKVDDYTDDDHFFEDNYIKLKELVIKECSNFKDTLSTCESLNIDSANTSKLKISSDKKKNIELDASIDGDDGSVNAIQTFENYLPKVSKIYLVNENKEEKNFETKYYYNGVNITRPNLHNFILKK